MEEAMRQEEDKAARKYAEGDQLQHEKRPSQLARASQTPRLAGASDRALARGQHP
jgi:hypothetical protein